MEGPTCSLSPARWLFKPPLKTQRLRTWFGNPRKRRDASKLTNLASSIAKKGYCKTSWRGRRPKVLESAAGEGRYRVVEQLTKEARGTEDYPIRIDIRVLSDLPPLAWVENLSLYETATWADLLDTKRAG